MAIDFPNNPTVDQEFAAGGSTWIWDGVVWTLKRIPTGAQGPQGEVGPQGPQGEVGPQGTSINVKASVATVSALPMTGNSVNDARIVDEDGDLYIWDTSSWTSAGQIVGPQGPKGDTGDTGPAGTTDYTLLTNKPDLSIYATESYVDTAVGNVTVDLSTAAGANIDWNSSTSQFDAVIPEATATTRGIVYGKTQEGSAGSVALGYNSFASPVNAFYNTSIGSESLHSLINGSDNIAIGSYSLWSATNSAKNTAVGTNSLYAVDAFGNTALGNNSGVNITEGDLNTLIGLEAGSSLTVGSHNIIVGEYAQASSNDASHEITLGNSDITKFRIPGLGINWTSSNIPGAAATTTTLGTVYGSTSNVLDGNITLGYSALSSIIEPSANIAIGENSLDSLTDGYYNVAIGPNALQAGTNVDQNIAIGQAALRLNLTGYQNVAIGSGSAYRASGNSNISVGSFSGYFRGGDFNVAVGEEAMGGSLFSSTINSSQNVAIGKNALRIMSYGDNNVVVGADAGGVWQGSNNIVIGYNAQASSSGVIDNEITLGNSNITKFRIPGLGIDWTTSNVPKREYNDNTQTASYTLTASDSSAIVWMNVATANTITIPTDSTVIPNGSSITVWQIGAGQTSIVGASGVTVYSNGSGTNGATPKLRSQFSSATIVKKSSSTWYVAGDIV